MTLLLSCSKGEHIDIVDIEPRQLFTFVNEISGITHLLEIQGDEVMLYTETFDGCFREAVEGDGIAVPISSIEVKEGLLVELSSGRSIIIKIYPEGAEIGGLGFANKVDKPWLINKCN